MIVGFSSIDRLEFLIYQDHIRAFYYQYVMDENL